MSLREYQVEALEAIRAYAAQGVAHQLVVLPTGAGKMIIAAHLPEHLGLLPMEQLLFLVHRHELVDQAVRKFRAYNPELVVDVERAGERARTDADVIVASVQSLAHQKRLARFDPDPVRVCFVDEAHHSIARQYRDVLKHFRMLKCESNLDPSKLLIGLTATPNRGDSIGLEQIFDKIVYRRNIREMIDEKWLADVSAYRVWTDHYIGDVSTRSGDLAIGELETAINTPARNNLIVEKFVELGKSMPALAFSIDVQHSKDLMEAFRNKGIQAQMLSGQTPKQERRDTVREFGAGRIPVLVSCAVLSEGADFPVATVALMARPTKSSLLYQQQVGRVLRPFPAPEDEAAHTGYRKDKAVVVDFADLSGRHRLISIGSLFGLRADFNAKGRSLSKIVRDVEKFEMERPGLDLRSAEAPEEMRSLVEKIDLFQPPVIPAVARKYSQFAWIEHMQGSYYLAIPDAESLLIKTNHLGQREVYRATNGRRTQIATLSGDAEAFEFADSLVPAEAARALFTTARWRKDEPSERQIKMLWWKDRKLAKDFGSMGELYDFAVKQYKAGNLSWTRGQVSQRISAVLEAP